MCLPNITRCLAALAIALAAMGSAVACSETGLAPANAGGDASSMDVLAEQLEPTDVADASEGDALDSTTLPEASNLDAPADVSLDAADAPLEAGAPFLVALSVAAAADASSALVLVPAFSPDVHDYYVRCAVGPSPWTVSMTASAGSSSLLLQPIASPALPQQTLQVSLAENQAVVAAATNGAATVEYWVRCLPPDFPVLQWTPHAEAGAPPPGYYLLGNFIQTTGGCYAMALDPNGVPVWYQAVEPYAGLCVIDVDSLVSGTISFATSIDNPPEFEIHQLSPLVTTDVSPTGITTDLHELRTLPNGDYLVISNALTPGVDLTGMQLPGPDGGIETLSGPQSILACNLVEFQPDGTVVWTWTATDHFDPVADSVVPMLFGGQIDPFHCNSIDVDPANGNLLVSARQMNSVFYIERSTGSVVWKMGGATASKDGATYVSVVDPFALQHDARLQPGWSSTCNGGSGQVSVFDDETAGQSAPSRGVLYDVVVGYGDAGVELQDGCAGGATAPGTATVTWQYAGQQAAPAMGSFRILPDGSHVIGWGLVPGLGFTEVDGNGNASIDLTFPAGDMTYRAIKVPLGAFDLGVLRSTAGLP